MAGVMVVVLLACLGTPDVAAPSGGGKMVLEGVDRYRVVEPVFEGVRVLLAHRGETYSPAYLQGISGAAFRIAGPCPCAPTCDCAMWTDDLLRLLGYEVEKVSLSEEGMDPEKEVGAMVARVKDEIRAGRPALVWHAFTNAEWDVVCGFDEGKKQLLGRGSYWLDDHVASADERRAAKAVEICPAFGAILVGRKTGTFDAREAELGALEAALRHAHAPRDRFLDQPLGRALPWRFRCGSACYEGWARSFVATPNRVPDNGDRYCLGIYRTTHRAAAGFVTELAAKYPEARTALLRAARHFEAEADALDEMHDKLLEGWAGWKEPDRDKSRRAAHLLDIAGFEYGEGIADVERALVAIDPDRAARARRPAALRREGDRTSLPEVLELHWDRGKECAFAGAVEAALAVTDHPYTYHDIMGLTGLAFRVRWSDDRTATKWCPSTAVGEMPDEYAAFEALSGWSLPTEYVEGEAAADPAMVESFRERIVASIGAGRPVILYPGHYNPGVAFGYADAGRTLLVRDYMSSAPSIELPVEKVAALRTFLGDYTAPPPLRETLRRSLSLAVANWRRERGDGGVPGREYWYGDAALAAWIADLGAYDGLPPDTRKSLRFLDAWCYVALHDARKAAASFLRDWATVLDGDGRAALLRAAGLYDEEVKALDGFLADKRATVKSPAGEWPEADRQREAQVLAAARGLEARAIAEMESALGALGGAS